MENRLMKMKQISLLVAAATASIAVVADDHKPANELEEMTIVGAQREALPGSAYALDQAALEAFDYSDVTRVVSQIPGVYVRNEDGFGLRPNIGIRGATADRSQKLTLMEDGILIKPAPYSAPTAYYFPNVKRMQGLEVVKGPATVKYGPHTVGGAMNLITPSVPEDEALKLKLSAGSFGYQDYQLKYGNRHGDIAYWVEGFRYESDGFKELDGGGDTGFVRNDYNAKIAWLGDKQNLTVKLGYADETSNETYLGLTEADFDANPNRRYASSALDQFNSEHQQIHVLHGIQFSDNISLNSAVYMNEYERSWNKVDGLVGTDLGINSVLANPTEFTRAYAVITGELDSDGTSSAPGIDVTNNDRSYGSSGVQFDLDAKFETGAIEHAFEAGLRAHNDYVERLHTPADYYMQGGELVFVQQRADEPKAFNKAETDAVSLYLSNKMSVGKAEVTVGVRSENIEGSFDDKSSSNADNTRSTTITTPSMGATYRVNDNWLVLAGLYNGFSPAGPQSPANIDHEESVNIEYGVRFTSEKFNADVIGFLSDYSNFLGRCRASDTGCTVGEEFNGGAVETSGIELLLTYDGEIAGLTVPISFNYTYTDSVFQERLVSSFSQWGTVQAGDEVPYVPEQVARINAALEGIRWMLNLGIAYTSETRDVPGQGAIPAAEIIPERTIVDLSGSYEVNDRVDLGLSVSNLTDDQSVVSRRPFAARPNMPRAVIGSVSYSF